MSTVESPVTIVVNRLALGPTAPDAGSPLLTRVGEVVAHQMVMDSRGFGSAGNLSNCFRGSRESHYPY